MLAVAVRREVLSGFDRDAVAKIVEVMEARGTRFLRRPAQPTAIRRHFINWGTDNEVQKFRVDFDDGRQEMYDTVLCATGRQYVNTFVSNVPPIVGGLHYF